MVWKTFADCESFGKIEPQGQSSSFDIERAFLKVARNSGYYVT